MSEQSGYNVQWNFDIRVSMDYYTVQERINGEFRCDKRISRCENLCSTIENLVTIPLFKFYFFKNSWYYIQI